DGFFVDKHHRRVIPKKARTVMKEAFDLFHSATAGHHGAMMTQFKINEEGITWASIANDIRTWISSCVTCKKIKASPKKSITRFRTQAEEPFHTICVDTMGPFPTSASGYKHILVIVDKFTRWVELKALKTLETAEATSAIMNRVVARFGLPMNIVSDGAKQFSCYLTDHLWDTFGITHHVTTPSHSQSNGAVERVNREIKRHLYALIHDILEKPEWDKALPLIQNIVNNTVHSSTGAKPHELLFGRRETRDLIKDWTDDRLQSKEELPKEHLDTDLYVSQITENIKSLIESAKKHQVVQAKAAKTSVIASETLVMIKRYPPPLKFQFPWEGPYKVLEKTSDVEYCVQSLLGAKRYAHIDDIKILGKDVDIDKAMNSLAQDMGRRIPKTVLEKTSDVEYCVQSLLGAKRYAHIDDIKILGKDVDIDKAMNSLAQDMGRRIPKTVLRQKGRGRNELFEVNWYGTPESKTTFIKRAEIEHKPGVSSEKIPVGVWLKDVPLSCVSKQSVESNWYPSIKASDVKYRLVKSDTSYCVDTVSLQAREGGHCVGSTFREAIAANPDFGADETINRLFLSGLRNHRLKDRIRSEADTAGKEEDLSFSMAQSFIKLSEMIQIRDGVLAHCDDFGLQTVKKKRFGDKQSLEDESGKEKKQFRMQTQLTGANLTVLNKKNAYDVWCSSSSWMESPWLKRVEQVLVVKAQCFNLPLQERKLMKNTWEVGAFPHDGTIDAMEKLVAEVVALQKRFIVEVDGKQTRLRCCLQSIVADTPRRKAILGYEGRLICSKCKCQDTDLFGDKFLLPTPS
ncbi:hypothetical protein ADUPG1_011402, partial [Aduncisulcus paluster]